MESKLDHFSQNGDGPRMNLDFKCSSSELDNWLSKKVCSYRAPEFGSQHPHPAAHNCL